MKVSAVYDMKIENPRKTIQELSIRMKFGGHVQKEKKKKNKIHSIWLLVFWIFAFFILLVLLILNAIVDGGSIFYFYTQRTFALVTIYFELGSLISMYGCYQNHSTVSGKSVDDVGLDVEQGGDFTVPMHGENFNLSNTTKTSQFP